MSNFVISDTHFNHNNIINYCKRPFNNVLEMNRRLIENWNNIVTNDDTVFHVGDFGFGSREMLSDILRMLNGKKILIIGNHDIQKVNANIKLGFNDVYKKEFILDNFIFTHFPLEYVPSDYINIHGHVHNTYFKQYDTDFHINVSADLINFTPVNLDNIHNIKNNYKYLE